MARGKVDWDDPRPFPWSGTAARAEPTGCMLGPVVCDHGPVVSDCCQPDDPFPVRHLGGISWVGVEMVHNVGGNVWEWVYDAYGAYEDERRSRLDPVVPDERLDGSELHCVRGGGYDWDSDSARATNRAAVPPSRRWPSYGIRCGRTFERSRTPLSPVPVPLDAPACDERPATSDPVRGAAWGAVEFCSPEFRSHELINGFLASMLGSSTSLVALGVEELEDGGARLTLGQAAFGAADDSAGSLPVLRWVSGLERAETAGQLCDGELCGLEGFPQASNRFDLDLRIGGMDGEMPFSLRGARLVAEHEDLQCGEATLRGVSGVPREGDLLLALEGHITRADAQAVSIGNEDLVHWICDRFEYCPDDPEAVREDELGRGICCENPGASCRWGCRAWPVRLGVVFRRLDG